MSEVREVPNRQRVAVSGDYIIVNEPKTKMTKREALEHAAWLVAMADDNDEFDDLLYSVMSL